MGTTDLTNTGAKSDLAGAISLDRAALIVVDGQHDFCEGGKLGVPGGYAACDKVAALLRLVSFDTVVFTQDWHIDPGDHFSDEPDFSDTWPEHCVAGTAGAELVPSLVTAMGELGAGVKVFSVHKGEYEAAYSGFDGKVVAGPCAGAGLEVALRAEGVTSLAVVGIEYAHCVEQTALGGAERGFAVTVLRDLCAELSTEASAAATARLEGAGVTLANFDGATFSKAA